MNALPQIEYTDHEYVKVNQCQSIGTSRYGFTALSPNGNAPPIQDSFIHRACGVLATPLAVVIALQGTPNIESEIVWTEKEQFLPSNHSGIVGSETTQTSYATKNPDIAPLSATDMVSSVREFFGLNMAQTARVFGVSRATLYNHVNTDTAPVTAYQELHTLVEKLAADSPNGLGTKIKSVQVENETLLDILYTKPLNLNRIEEVTKIIIATKESDRPKIGLNKLRSTISGIHSAKTG